MAEALNQAEALRALRAVDLDWVQDLNSVWLDSAPHVPAIHQELVQRVCDALEALNQPFGRSPLGRIVRGAPGIGKTHLLGALRRRCVAAGHFFILSDLIGVDDFWGSMALHYVQSLLQPIQDDRGPSSQLMRLLERLAALAGQPDADRLPVQLRGARPQAYRELEVALFPLLKRYDPAQATLELAALRALLLLNSDDPDLTECGYHWLQGLSIDYLPEDAGLRRAPPHPAQIVGAVSALMSLVAPTLLAVDQLDAIIAQQGLLAKDMEHPEPSGEQRTAQAIITGVTGGLTDLRDVTRRTLTLVSCLPGTVNVLTQQGVSTFGDRFHPPARLNGNLKAELLRQVIEARLAVGYRATGFVPPYPSWPFRPDAFQALEGATPREVLRQCDGHRERCLGQQAIAEITAFASEPEPPSPAPDGVQQQFETLRDQARLTGFNLEAAADAEQAELARHLLQTLPDELALPAQVDAQLETDFPGRVAPLHARLRLIFHDRGEHEAHFSLRILVEGNALAFQNRLHAAMTESGIEAALRFRRLALVRVAPLPSGAKTQQQVAEFQHRGGRFVALTPDDLATAWALGRMLQRPPEGFAAWLREARPLLSTPFAHASGLLDWLRDAGLLATPGQPSRATAPPVDPPDPDESSLAFSASTSLPLGLSTSGQAQTLTPEQLTKHIAIVAGAGSGKTVLVKTLIEEAVLAGIPAIVIDPANDLARLGDPWPAPPDAWDEIRRERAAAYARRAEVVIWTPGRQDGNPFLLRPLPDFAAVRDDEAELESALQSAAASIAPLVDADGRSAKAKRQAAVLMVALRTLAERALAPDLATLGQLLRDLPEGLAGGISDADKLAVGMADLIESALINNPMLAASGEVLEIGELLRSSDSGRVRVSVVNLMGLPGLEAQRRLLDQIAVALFGWIKRHPARQGIQGLLVLDEAKDFIPARASTACKASLMRLVSQARKYGLGLVFATQEPKSIAHEFIANCSTQFFGRGGSPAVIETVTELLRNAGAQRVDVGRLHPGEFYLRTDCQAQPARLHTLLCLSDHSGPLDEAEVLQRARAARLAATRQLELPRLETRR